MATLVVSAVAWWLSGTDAALAVLGVAWYVGVILFPPAIAFLALQLAFTLLHKNES